MFPKEQRPIDKMKKTEKIKMMELIEREVTNLKNSELCNERKKNGVLPVIGEGNLDADFLFIGEAPGKNESESGKPFCGASGKVLDQLLLHIGVKRSDVYITNIVKDRPPKNRDPKPKEIEQYAPFLDRQIEIIKPKVIATLGRFSMEYIMNRYGLQSECDAISNVRGKIFDAKIGKTKVKVVPLYHPAVAIYNRKRIGELEKDFEVLKGV